MKQKTLLLTLVSVCVYLLVFAQPAWATNPLTIPNPNKITVASIGINETVDHAWMYDTASAELVMNVYDTLIKFDWEDPATFTPSIATDWGDTVAESPYYDPSLTVETGYAMKVRFGPLESNVKWQDWGETYSGAYSGIPTNDYLTTEDVEYSFERWMFMDRSGGPTWMIFEALFGPGIYHTYHLTDPETEIPAAIQQDGTYVWFNFKTTYSLTIFYQVVAQGWGSIIDKDWAIPHGAWDGNPANWLTYNDPPISPFDDPEPEMMGSGTYKGPNPSCSGTWGYVDYLAETWTIRRFADYWEGWPAPGCSDYVDEVTEITEYNFAQRKILFLSDSPAAQADLVYIPRANIYDAELLAAIANGKVRFIKDLETLSMSAGFFNFDLPDNSPYAGDFQWGSGIPKNFFADKHVRYAAGYAFNWAQYITQVFLGEASQPATPLIKGLGYDELYEALNDQYCYGLNLTEVEYNLKLAHGGSGANAAHDPALVTAGDLWTQGFTMTLTYNKGNVARRDAALMLKNSWESVEPFTDAFNIDVLEVIWSTYLGDLVNYPLFRTKMAYFVIGWLADYPHPHNWFFPYCHTYGDFTYFQSYSNATVDAKIELGITQEKPESLVTYGDLMEMFYQEYPDMPLVQALGRHYERTWIQGWYYNTIEPGYYYKRIWKGIDADVNADGSVSVADGGVISNFWHQDLGGGNFFDGPGGYDRSCDIDPVTTPAPYGEGDGLDYPVDGLVNMEDVGLLQRCFGSGPP